jgi:hypothetical protein
MYFTVKLESDQDEGILGCLCIGCDALRSSVVPSVTWYTRCHALLPNLLIYIEDLLFNAKIQSCHL